MFGFDEAREHHDEVYSDHHKAKLSHEVLAGGAAFAAMKYFEDQQRRKGETVNHGFAKELLAGFAAAEVDKLVESKGLDYVDREKAKHHAKKQAEHLYDEQYGRQDYYDPGYEPHPSMRY